MEVTVKGSGYARPVTVACVDGGEGPTADLYLAALPGGPIIVLSGAAAALYRAVVDGADPVSALASALAVEEAEIDEEGVRELLTEWIEQDLLSNT